MRALFAVSLWLSVLALLPPLFGESPKGFVFASYPEAKQPTGIAHIIDLSWLSKAGPARTLHWVFVVSLLAYALVPFRLLRFAVLPVFAIHLIVFTYNNSQGSTHHGYQIQTQCLLAQTLLLWWPSIHWLAGRARLRLPSLPGSPDLRSLWVYYTQLTIAAAYVIAGFTKIARSGLGWIADSPLICVQVVKTHTQNYYNWLDPQFAGRGVPVAEWIAAHPWLTRGMLTSGLLLELFAFVCLLGRGWAAALGAAMIGLHVSISLVMHLHFPQNEQVCLIFLVNLPFWCALLGAKLRKARPGAAR